MHNYLIGLVPRGMKSVFQVFTLVFDVPVDEHTVPCVSKQRQPHLYTEFYTTYIINVKLRVPTDVQKEDKNVSSS